MGCKSRPNTPSLCPSPGQNQYSQPMPKSCSLAPASAGILPAVDHWRYSKALRTRFFLLVHRQYLWKTCHHFFAVWGRVNLKNYSDSQEVYLPEAFFGFSIAVSGAELWSKNSGVSLGSDTLIVKGNNWLMVQFNVLFEGNFVSNVVSHGNIHLR